MVFIYDTSVKISPSEGVELLPYIILEHTDLDNTVLYFSIDYFKGCLPSYILVDSLWLSLNNIYV